MLRLPHVVNDKKLVRITQERSQRRRSLLNRISAREVNIQRASPRHQFGEYIGRGAKRSPQNAVGECNGDVRVVR